ncbi:LysR family transcriptional regulator [Salinicola endophyticus]|uniref:LysR family transcriptional regulator n=2 Tax=Salinicola TaxID=404432 RepID=A0ABY8FFR8_9GAMM|nr:LysR family transcriptional regulator [Salinicola endophyticus]WFF41639.1 LysR family transcriptional regulator [Salinicola endophyticus]
MRYEADMAIFHAVLSAGSFSGAAANLGLTHSAVSKRITALEDRLGVQLLIRSTRHLRLTNAGELYAAETRDILARLTAVETEVAEGAGTVRGRIRVTASNALGRMHVVPALFAFMQRYPEVQVDLTLTDTVVDIVQEGMDLAIRSANLQDSRLVARKLATNRRMACASPVYLAARGTPQRPEDMHNHACLRLNLAGSFNQWGLASASGQRVQLGAGFSCNSLETLHAACRQGHGIAWLPLFLVKQDIEDNVLLPVLEAYRDATCDTSISIVRPHMHYVPNRLRVLTDFIVDWFDRLAF